MISRLSKATSLAAESQGLDRFLGLLLLAAAVALLAGWLLPVMTVRTLLVFYDEVSILTGAYRLLERRECSGSSAGSKRSGAGRCSMSSSPPCWWW